jgi:hypothetical protein
MDHTARHSFVVLDTPASIPIDDAELRYQDAVKNGKRIVDFRWFTRDRSTRKLYRTPYGLSIAPEHLASLASLVAVARDHCLPDMSEPPRAA